MAHPQTNFSSNFQGAQVLDATLDIKVNGKSNEYQPSGEDKTVELVEPIIFEASDNPTYAEVNEAIGNHVPVYIHVTGTNVDYMLPYVGQSNVTNQLFFAIPDTQANGIRYYIVRNGAPADTGIALTPEVYRLQIQDPENEGVTDDAYQAIVGGAYKTAILVYGPGQAAKLAYLQVLGTTTRFVSYNASLSQLEIFTIDPTEVDGYHAVTKSIATLGSTGVYKVSILDPVTSGMTVKQFNTISGNTYKTAILEYSMGGSTVGEAILVSKGSNGLAFAVYTPGQNKLVVFEVASSIVDSVHPITRTEVAVAGSVTFVATYDSATDTITYPNADAIATAIANNEDIILSYRDGTNADVYHLSGHDTGYFEFVNASTGRKFSCKFDDDTQMWIWSSAESAVGEVVSIVEELATDLDSKVTTTFPFAQITDQSDFAGYGVGQTTRMIGQLFAVPIASEIRQDETLLCVNAKQAFAGKVSFGIFEYDFEANGGQGSTYWIADTGVVSVQSGENEFPLTLVNNGSHKLQSSKLYYLVLAIASDAPATGLFLGSAPNYAANTNAAPKYTLLVSNMDNFIDWLDGHLNAAWFQGYNEESSIPRLFAMFRNAQAQPIPTPGPFTPIDNFTLEHVYRVSNLFSITPDTSGLIFSKIIPTQTVTITKFRYVDYHGSVNSAAGLPVLLDDTYTQLVNNQSGTWTLGDSDQAKIDGTHYVHEFTFQTPVTLQANTPYWILTGGNFSNQANEWVITYQSPVVKRDLLLAKNGYNVNPYIIAGGDGEFQSQQPGMYIQLTDDNNNTWTI